MPASESRGASAVGTRLGAYDLTGFIAEGGMGTVFAARSRLTGELRAVKVLRAELAAEPEFIARFMREMRIAAAVEHPNLVRVYEPGMEGDTLFLPMELLEGETLAKRLQRSGPMEESQAVALVRTVGDAILAVHQQGILHRDLKPSNIFLVRTDTSDMGDFRPKVLDLGAAKDIDANDEATSTGMVIGSPHYMSFEQASGRKDLDARTDQYSLAVVLYEALTGIRPYDNDAGGNAMSKLLAGVRYKTPREVVPTISSITEEVVLRGMQRLREERYPTLRDFLAALPGTVDEATRIAPAAAPVRPAPGLVSVASVASVASPASSGAPAPAIRQSTGRSGPTAIIPRPSAFPAALLGIVTAVVVVLGGYAALRSLRAPPPKKLDPSDFAVNDAPRRAPPVPIPAAAPQPIAEALPAAPPEALPAALPVRTTEPAPPAPPPAAATPARPPSVVAPSAVPASLAPPAPPAIAKPRAPRPPPAPPKTVAPPCQPTPTMPCL